MKTIRTTPPDLIILDIMLPGKDGLEILKEIRREHLIPVLMLTAKGEATDRIVGLELGGDDYLPKPFNPRELLARMKAILRRAVSGEKDDSSRKERLYIKAGGLTLNTARQTVSMEDQELELSSAEYRILEVLMKHPNTVLSRDQLMNLARGRDFMAFDRSIDVHISKIRAKRSQAAGSGLGLAIAKKSIERQGGIIEAYNAEIGLEIRITLPDQVGSKNKDDRPHAHDHRLFEK